MHFAKDDMHFAKDVLKKSNVLLLPGSLYDYEGYFRIGFGRKNTQEALSQFETYIKEKMITK